MRSRDARDYPAIGKSIGELVEKKQAAYGDSFGRAGAVLRALYPGGVPPNKYDDMLCIVRIIDKLFRIATDRDAMGEDPYLDVAGYAILGATKLSGTQVPKNGNYDV